MSDFVSTADALRTRLQAFTSLPLFWPNDDRTPTPELAPNGFVYSEIAVQDEQQMTLGNPALHRDYGELTIYVYVPRGSRIGTAEGYAEQIRGLFGTTAVSGVNVTKKTIGRGQGVDGPSGKAYAVPVYIEFNADRTE